MSVILFAKESVFQEMANEYEGLKQLLRPSKEVDDTKFYKALRRLYFANVATFLCQYHDDTKLSEYELTSIDPFQSLQGVAEVTIGNATHLSRFISAWNSLKYNCVTNDGEEYIAKESREYIEGLITYWTERVLETFVEVE